MMTAQSDLVILGEIRPLDTEDQTLMNSELMVFGMRLNFHSLATFCVMTGAIQCSVHSTKMQLQTRVLHWMALLHPHILVRCMMYSGASSVFTGRCFGFSVFCVVVMSCISFYRHFSRPHRTVCVIKLNSSACQTTQVTLWIVTFLLGTVIRSLFKDVY